MRCKDDRTARLLREAERLLHVRQLEHRDALSLRESLQRRLLLLESLEQPASAPSILQHLAIIALPVPRPLRQTPLEVSDNGVALEALPASHKGYSTALARRVACMTLGDTMQVYKAFLARCVQVGNVM